MISHIWFSMKISVILFFLIIINLSAQEFTNWQNYSAKENIRDVIYDNGYLWAATDGGAFGYNSVTGEFRQLTKSEGLSSQNLTSVTSDESGKIWFGTSEGIINIYNPVNGTVAKILDIYNTEKTQKSINDLFHKNDTIYVAMDFGLSLIDANSLFFLETVRKFGDFTTEIEVKSVSKKSRISISTSEGIAVSKSGISNFSAPGNWISLNNSNLPDASEVSAIIEDNDGNYVIASNNGVQSLSFANNTLSYSGIDFYAGTGLIDVQFFPSVSEIEYFALSKARLFLNDHTAAGSINSGDFTSFCQTATGDFYIGSTNGLYDLTNDSLITPNSPAGNTFNGIGVDESGGVWVGSGSGAASEGIYYFDGTTWLNYNTANVPQIRSNRFYEIYISESNEIYASNWGEGFTRIFENDFETIYTGNSPMQGILNDPNFLVVTGMQKDSKDNLWVLNYQSATREHLSVLTADSNWYNFRFDNPTIANNEILDHLVIDRFNTKWFTVFLGDRGLYYFNENNTLDNTADDSYGFINTADGLNSNLISALAIDKRGELWIGTSEGVNTIFSVSNPKASITNKILLNQQTVTCIAVDPLDRKWIGTTEGVFVVSPDGSSLIQHINESYSPDGIIRPLPNNNILSIAIDKNNGMVYIGTDFGMTSLRTSAVAPQTEIQELFAYPNPYSFDENKRITISNLIADTDIKILSVSGDLINDSEQGTVDSPGGNLAFWNGKNFKGEVVPSGIYIIVSYDAEAKSISSSKIAVINK